MRKTAPFSVSVDLGIVLARHTSGEQYRKPKITMQLDRPVTLEQLLRQLGIPSGYIGFVTVNGEKRDLDAQVCPGDNIVVFPYITGG